MVDHSNLHSMMSVPKSFDFHEPAASAQFMHTAGCKTNPEAFVTTLTQIEAHIYQFGFLLGQCTRRRMSNRAIFNGG